MRTPAEHETARAPDTHHRQEQPQPATTGTRQTSLHKTQGLTPGRVWPGRPRTTRPDAPWPGPPLHPGTTDSPCRASNSAPQPPPKPTHQLLHAPSRPNEYPVQTESQTQNTPPTSGASTIRTHCGRSQDDDVPLLPLGYGAYANLRSESASARVHSVTWAPTTP